MGNIWFQILVLLGPSLRAAEPVETEQQMARLGLLMELLEQRGVEYYEGEEKDEELQALIDFLCTD